MSRVLGLLSTFAITGMILFGLAADFRISFGRHYWAGGAATLATGNAIKRVIAWQLAEAMKEKKTSKAEMARRLKTSRTQIARFLDPENCSVQLDTMQKAAAIVGKRLVIKLEDIPRSSA